VDDVINAWAAELERRSRSFARCAGALGEWDGAVRGARAALLDAEARVRGAAASQAALDRKLGLIEAHHKEIHDALASMEGAAARAYAADAPSLDADGRARDALYGRAAALGAALARCGDDLRSAIADVNAGALAAAGDGEGAPGGAGGPGALVAAGGDVASTTPPGASRPASLPPAAQLGKLVRVLNSQLQALADLDERCDVLEARLGALPGGGGGGSASDGGRGGGENGLDGAGMRDGGVGLF
jgi:nuclear pore complex protein Nup62